MIMRVRFFLCRNEKSRRFILFIFLHFFLHFYQKGRKKRKRKNAKLKVLFVGYTKSNASQIEYYVVVKGRRGREIAHGVSSETLSGLRVLVRGARGRDSRVWCGSQRRARLLFRGEKCKGKEEDVKETEDQCLYVFVIKIKYSLPSLSLSESLSL